MWAQKELPYLYGFENNDIAEEGWTRVSTQSLTTIQTIGNTGFVSKTGSYSFRFYYKTTEDQYLISPLLDDSPTGIDVSFYYNNNGTGSSSVEKFSVGYSTTTIETSAFVWDDEVTSNDTEWHHYESSYPNGVKYIAIKYSSASKYRLYIDDINIEITEEYKRPKNLIVTSYTSSSADLSWTAGSDESAWQIAYSTKEGFDPDTEGVKVAVGNNPYTLTGLTDGVTYYAYVRSNYSGNYSAWCNDKLKFSPKTVISLCSDNNNKTSSNVAVPNYTAYSSYLTKSQMIYPYSDVSTFAGKYIVQLTFYATTQSIDWGTATYDVYLAETSTSSYGYSAEFIDWSNCTKVVEGTNLKVSDGKLIINLTTPFLYTGADSKNLLIGFQQTSVSASTVSSTWHAKNISSIYPSAAYYYNGSSLYSTGQSYLPYVTIGYAASTVPVTLGSNGYATFASPRPLDLTAENLPSGLKAYKAAVGGSRVYFTEVDQAVAANTGVLLEGAPEGNYDIPVADSGTSLEGVNDFLVNSIGGTFSNDEDYTYYALKKNSSPLVFGTFNPSTAAIPTNKAYLKVENEYAVKGLTFEFDNPTAVQSIKEAQPAMKGAVYDLSGRKVMNSTLRKGLYIVGGKKMLVK